jgi:hypothetical protein
MKGYPIRVELDEAELRDAERIARFRRKGHAGFRSIRLHKTSSNGSSCAKPKRRRLIPQPRKSLGATACAAIPMGSTRSRTNTTSAAHSSYAIPAATFGSSLVICRRRRATDLTEGGK